MTASTHSPLRFRGWRDRATGTMHLHDCPDFDRIDASRVENTVWEEHGSYDRLCRWCFPSPGETGPLRPGEG